jgi:hypothetical protein
MSQGGQSDETRQNRSYSRRSLSRYGQGYKSYLQTLLPLMRPGGLIMADNVAMAQDYVAVTTDPQLDTVFFGRFAVTLKKR